MAILPFVYPSSVSMDVNDLGDELKASSEISSLSQCLLDSAELIFLGKKRPVKLLKRNNAIEDLLKSFVAWFS